MDINTHSLLQMKILACSMFLSEHQIREDVDVPQAYGMELAPDHVS